MSQQLLCLSHGTLSHRAHKRPESLSATQCLRELAQGASPGHHACACSCQLSTGASWSGRRQPTAWRGQGPWRARGPALPTPQMPLALVEHGQPGPNPPHAGSPGGGKRTSLRTEPPPWPPGKSPQQTCLHFPRGTWAAPNRQYSRRKNEAER